MPARASASSSTPRRAASCRHASPAYVKKAWRGYEAQEAAACAQVLQCRYDHGAAMRIAATAADLTPGGDGMTVAGNAQLADAEWKAMDGFIDRFPAS